VKPIGIVSRDECASEVEQEKPAEILRREIVKPAASVNQRGRRLDKRKSSQLSDNSEALRVGNDSSNSDFNAGDCASDDDLNVSVKRAKRQVRRPAYLGLYVANVYTCRDMLCVEL
jgi:hypothetical protein